MATILRDVGVLLSSMQSGYAATPKKLKIIDLYVIFAIATALVQVVYMATVGSFPFNSFLSGFLLSCGTAVLAVCLRMQINPKNKEFKRQELELQPTIVEIIRFCGEVDNFPLSKWGT